jgi:hypothetical protein
MRSPGVGASIGPDGSAATQRLGGGSGDRNGGMPPDARPGGAVRGLRPTFAARSLHSITLVGASETESGIVRPSACEVFKLMINSIVRPLNWKIWLRPRRFAQHTNPLGATRRNVGTVSSGRRIHKLAYRINRGQAVAVG